MPFYWPLIPQLPDSSKRPIQFSPESCHIDSSSSTPDNIHPSNDVTTPLIDEHIPTKSGSSDAFSSTIPICPFHTLIGEPGTSSVEAEQWPGIQLISYRKHPLFPQNLPDQ